MAPFQCGKTETTLNVVGYYIQHEPAPMLSVLEEKDKAEDWSKNRLSSMLAETPCLNGLVRNSRGKDSQNTLTFKEFPGGYLAIAGAGSEAQLTSRPIRVVIMDELDKWKSLRAGDPEQLAANRTITYRHRKKIIRVSTPRDKGISRIEDAYLRSDQRKFYMPCPHCQHKQVLYMGKETDSHGLKWTYKEGAVKEVEI